MIAVAFPSPPPGLTWTATAIYWGVGILLLACFAIYVWRALPKPQKWEPAFWLAAMATSVWLLTLYHQLPWYWQSRGEWVSLAIAAIWILAISGVFMWLLQQSDKLHSAASFVIIPIGLASMFCFCPFSSFVNISGPARRTDCAYRLRQSALAMHNFHDSQKRLPLANRTDPNDDVRPDVSWRIQILPFTEYEVVYDTYDQMKSWDDPVNKDIAKTNIDFYSCPSNWWQQDSRGRYYSDYYALTGHEAIFDGRTTSLDEIPDGTSKTILLVEAPGQQIIWTEPRDIDVESSLPGVNLPGASKGRSAGWLSSYHRSGANVAFADGSIHTLSPNISPEVLRQLMTANGGENPVNY